MTLQAAYLFFESLKNETKNKSEIKIYDKFMQILNGLKNRKFSTNEMHLLETKLENLNLESYPENRKKFFRNALSIFENYLMDTFSFIPKGHYTNIGVGLGTSFGILFGVIALSSFERSIGIALGLILGMILGLIIGTSLDFKAKKENRVL